MERRLAILRWIMVFLTLSTLVHYTHNFVEVDQYPKSFVPNWVTRVGVFVTWPAFTAFGVAGYRLYRRGRFPLAHACLITYSTVGWLTLGHFTSGNPDIPAFFYATLFTDAIGAAMVTAWVVWSARLPETTRRPVAP